MFKASFAGKFTPATNSGFDRITDFDRGEGDRIDLRFHKEATDFADLRDGSSKFGTDTHLRLGADTIVLEDVTLEIGSVRLPTSYCGGVGMPQRAITSSRPSTPLRMIGALWSG